ncbi:hypothetical protein [Streptomyces sp. NBC_01235]|uniref:hypothetical protein n=1 Tax=Streptomyces sp. NBC_01235 TaxID=2903788 RepID=UPI002E14D6BC|nr:hypothetical protein OG289_42195 [Streptomyces sp. NBC_01235]
MSSHVEQAVAARIAAARRKAEAERKRRAEFAAARQAGLAKRHAAKLLHLAETSLDNRTLAASSV